jgi:cyclopropane-fatty-acyl-phospholipid synthase
MAFTHENFHIFQLQLAKRGDVVPDNRNYIQLAEQRLAEFEKTRLPMEKVEF